jgi:hypothetical protein
MVLKRQDGNPALRYILGICIFAVSIYVFYILSSMRSSPELFLIPVPVGPETGTCRVVSTDAFSACIPVDIDCSARNGRLGISSAKYRIRGSIEVLDRLPGEKAWRVSLHNRFIEAFIGDERKLSTSRLMNTILNCRYNPTLMGAKASLIPPWMKNTKGARILAPEDEGVIFYTPAQVLGLSFRKGTILVVSIKGQVTVGAVAGVMRSICLISPEGQGTGSRGAL